MLLRGKEVLLRRRERFFATLLSTDSHPLNPGVVEQVTQRPTIRATSTARKSAGSRAGGVGRERPAELEGAPGDDALHAELLNIDDDDLIYFPEASMPIFVEL